SFTSVCAQRGQISRGDNRQVDVLREVMGHSIEAIDPGSAHRARTRLLLSEHEVIDHQRTIRGSEQLAQPYVFCGSITIVQGRWAFKKLVILNRRTLRKSSSKLCDFFTLLS